MPERTLRGCYILVAEDEYLLAEDLCAELNDAGALVIGPAGAMEEVLSLINSASEIDGAVLDVNLRGEMIFPAADLLIERGVPFILTTGYDPSAIPSRFDGIVRCEKPINMARVKRALERVIDP